MFYQIIYLNEKKGVLWTDFIGYERKESVETTLIKINSKLGNIISSIIVHSTKRQSNKMEKSPLQLMARMASVVKGQYPETTQIKDVVEPSDDEKCNSITEPLENTVVTKKDVTESISNR